jgi:hypothetical protein
MGDMLTMNSLGDGSTLSLDFTTGVLDSRLTFSRAGGGTYVGADGYIYGVDSATSASLAIGTGSKSVTLTATASVDRRFQVGQTVYFSSGANNMSGLVTAYDASTQVITINATATTGSGSFTSWFVGNASPRFDYSPTTIGEPRGLLIEGQTANAVTYSEDFANAAWTKSGIAQTPASGTSPDNNNTATLIAENAGGFIKHSLERSVTVTAGSVYTWSVFLKQPSSNSRRYACIQVADGQATAARNTVVFDLQTGTVTANGVNNGTAGAPTDVAHSITPYKDGWYRVSVTMKYVSSPCYPVVMLSDISTLYGGSNQPFYTATVPYKGLLVWGAQLELGSGASSLIPTGASGVTRNADACSLTGSNFTNVFGDASLGTITCSHEFPRANHGVAHQPTPFGLGSYTAANARGYSYANYAVGIGGYGWVYTSASFGSATTSAVSAARNKCGLSYNGLAITAALNGTTASSTGTGTITVSSAVGLQIGYNTTPRDFINACVSNIKFYPTALTAAQLQSLTAP